MRLIDTLDINVQSKIFIISLLQTDYLFIVKLQYINDLNGNYHLVIYLIRDDVVSPQKFNAGIGY